jgi:hypothetical protein
MQNGENDHRYELFAVVSHMISGEVSHYELYSKPTIEDRWRCINDISVSEVSFSEIQRTFGHYGSSVRYSWRDSEVAYILAYIRVSKVEEVMNISFEDEGRELIELCVKMDDHLRMDEGLSIDLLCSRSKCYRGRYKLPANYEELREIIQKLVNAQPGKSINMEDDINFVVWLCEKDWSMMKKLESHVPLPRITGSSIDIYVTTRKQSKRRKCSTEGLYFFFQWLGVYPCGTEIKFVC